MTWLKHAPLVLAVPLLFGPSGCVSHRYTVRQPPERVVNSWDTVDTTPPGTRIDLLLAGGDTVRGTLRRSQESAVTILVDSTSEMSFTKDQIQEVRATSADGLANGTLIGLGIGAAGGSVNGAFGGKEAFWSTVGWSLGLGILIDALIAHHEILYQAR